MFSDSRIGAYAGATGVVPPGAIERAIETEFEGDKSKFVETSIAAFRAGLESVCARS